MCPRCAQNAPLIYRGAAATCAACGAPRVPLTGKSLQLVGQPSRVGGVVARVFGWIVLSVGMLVAIGVGVGTQLLFPNGFAGAILGVPIAVLSLVLGVTLIRSGGLLHRSGASAERDARVQAIQALAAHKGGGVTAQDVSSSLEIPKREAEALLDALAREDFENVTVDVNADGAVVYRFDARTRVRVDPEVARSPNREEWERLDAQAEAEKQARTRAQR
jgi:hypothetical protein